MSELQRRDAAGVVEASGGRTEAQPDAAPLGAEDWACPGGRRRGGFEGCPLVAIHRVILESPGEVGDQMQEICALLAAYGYPVP